MSQTQRMLRRIEQRIEGEVREYRTIARLGERITQLEELAAKRQHFYNLKADECRRWFRLLVRIVDAADTASLGREFRTAASTVDAEALFALYGVLVEAKHALVEELGREGGRSLADVIELVRERMANAQASVVGGSAGVGAVIEVE